MKRLLILPIILAVTVFSLYHKASGGMDINIKNKGKVELKIEKGLNIHNNSKNEIDENLQEKIMGRAFLVEISGELNITKENPITLNAEVKNIDNLEAFNYWWYENKELLEIGPTLEKAFDKGQHNITLVVRDGNGTEVNSSVVVNAYNYKSITTFHYDAYYGGLLYRERRVINHKGQYVLYDDGRYSKELRTYDDKRGVLLERAIEYYDNAENNRKTKFTYDESGNRLVEQTFDNEGISSSYLVYVYDENSTLIDMKYGTSEEDIENDEEGDDEVTTDDLSSYIEEKIPEDVIKLNDNGKVIYEAFYYGKDDKVITTMTYNEDNQLIHSERESKSPYDKGITIIDYDEKGNEINKEMKYQLEGEALCHYRTKNTFTDSNQIRSQVSTFLGGDCPYLDEIKRFYHYNEEGEVIDIKAIIDGEELSEAYSTLEVIKAYTNELDI